MSKLKEPVRPYPPFKPEFEEKIVRKYIYSCVESLEEEGWYDDEDEEKEELEGAGKPIEEVTLAWLLEQCPKGISPKDIKVEFGYNTSSMAYEDHFVRFYYETVIPARTVEYEEAVKEYEQSLERYEQAMMDYTEALRQQEIKATEAKLKKLKGK